MPEWRRATACGASACVEVTVDGHVWIRDSKDPDGPILRFTADEWAAFCEGVKAGEFECRAGSPPPASSGPPS